MKEYILNKVAVGAQVPTPREKRFFSKTFDQLSQVEKAITFVLAENPLDSRLTLLVNLDQIRHSELWEAEEMNERLKTYWKKLLGPKTDFGFFYNREIGTVFIAGPLSELFLYDVDGKKLGELSAGPYGILRGLGIDETDAVAYIRKLNEGCYLLLIRGHGLDLNALENALYSLEKAG